MQSTDTKKMSLDELLDLERKVKADIARQRNIKKQEVLAQIQGMVHQYDLSYDEILSTVRGHAKRGKAPALYRNPANPRQTWSGKGPAPAWYLEAPDPQALKI